MAEAAPVSMKTTVLHSRVPLPVLRSIFKKYDTNGDGQLDESEWKELFKDVDIPAGKTDELLLKLGDSDGDGKIDMDEFLKFVAEVSDVALDSSMKDTLDLITNAWDEMDADHSGSVSKSEFTKYFKSLGFDDEHIAKQWASADTDGDGVLSLMEFWNNCIAGA